VSAGAAVAFQAAFNGRVSVASGQPTAAALVNFVVGLTTLLVLLVVEHEVLGRPWPQWPSPLGGHWWLYVGGAMGLFFVVTAAWTVRALGVLLFSLVVLSGTLLGAVAVDIVVPTGGAQLTGTLVLGVCLTFASVALAVGRVPARRRSSGRIGP
jgi:transporter family-2 protein